MPLNYEYDEASTTWPFFVLTVAFMCVVPMTLRELYGLIVPGGEKQTGDGLWSELHEKYTSDDVKLQRRQNKPKKSRKGLIFVALGWLFIAVLINYIKNNDSIYEAISGVFDPYDLLGISSSATERDVRSAYRKLSIRFHPDKLSKDLSGDERTALEEQFVLINKAYKALTDEATMENYRKYGHPDGPQSTTHGIALPRFLVEGSGSPLVLVAYFLLLAVALPWFVSKWWSKSQTTTKYGIHSKTASLFVDKLFNFKPSYVVVPDLIINWISEASEYKSKYPELSSVDIANLIHAHINREKSSHDYAKNYVIRTSSLLLQQMIEIASMFRNVEVALIAIDTFKSVVQATPSSPHAQIFQLPNVDKSHFLNSTVDEIRTLGKLFTFSDEKIGKILGINDDSELKDTLTVASRIPKLRHLSSSFKVRGSELDYVLPGSTPHIKVKVLVRSPRQKLIPNTLFSKELLEAVDPLGLDQDPFEVAMEQPLLPETFAPAFPVKRRGGWYCLVVSQKDNKVVQTPSLVSRLSLENMKIDFDKRKVKNVEKEFDSKEWVVGTFVLPFAQPAPNEEGTFFFRIVIKSTDYFGSDLDFTVPMVVKNAPIEADPKAEAIKELYSDEEESEKDDSEDSGAEDSDEEFEDDTDFTDIDTDTEDEMDPLEKKAN